MPTSNESLVDALLAEQQQTTAVEKFTQAHLSQTIPLQAKHYSDLIPLSKPTEGQQYAFEVDLDICSGCKSCVTACHSLNGLEEQETWRNVGLLHGGNSELPVIQHVTTACHHCIEPACLEGCPTLAYEKDPITGIVRHLDDQCFGCQYCILKCPYDVPKYSASKGIVRKCDMCEQRLASEEAPACVQSCPNSAIKIVIVNTEQVIEESETNRFLPGAPEPSYTKPTTNYRTSKPQPRNLLPADYYSARRSHSHLPLIVMLILTQMSVGALFIDQILLHLFGNHAGSAYTYVQAMHAMAACGLGLLGMNAAIFHLGRPQYAYRAFLGLRTSWMSREIIMFGLFAVAATTYTALSWVADHGWHISLFLQRGAGIFAAATGILSVACSIMIYVDTNRPFWRGSYTTLKFLGTALVLGIPTTLLISWFAAGLSVDVSVTQLMSTYGRALCSWLIGLTIAKLTYEVLIFAHLSSKLHTPLRRTAMLMTGELRKPTLARFAFGFVGGIATPCVLLAGTNSGAGALFICVLTVASFVALLIGEFLERYLFFTAVVAPKMPGSTAS